LNRKTEYIVRTISRLLILVGLMVLLTLPTFVVHADEIIEPQIGTETPVEASTPEIEDTLPVAPLEPIDPAVAPEGAVLLIPPAGTGSEEPQDPALEPEINSDEMHRLSKSSEV
jgi:hypothetical protein